MTTKFVVFSFPRSGSTWLCSRLDRHPEILCHLEVFHREAIGTVRGFADRVPESSAFTMPVRDRRPADFIDLLFGHPLGATAVGFKIFVGHSEEAHRIILGDRTIKKIILDRSTTDAYVSVVTAKRTGQFTRTSPRDKTRTRVDIDARSLLGFDRVVNSYIDGIRTHLRDSGQRFLELRYEEIVADETAFNGVFDFLGIERGRDPLVPFTHRQGAPELEEKVSNVKQLVEDLVTLYRNKP